MSAGRRLRWLLAPTLLLGAADGGARPPAATSDGATLGLASWLGAPPEIDLGTIPVGTTARRTVVLRNGGDLALEPVQLALLPAGDELAVEPPETTIAASSTRAVELRCTPDAAHVVTGTLAITAPGATAGSPLELAVHCTGASGELHAVPASLALGEIRLDAGPVTATLALHTITTDLPITAGPLLAAPAPAGMTLGAPSSPTIRAAAPALLELAIAPELEGDLATTITVTAGTTISIPITGVVVRAAVAVPDAIHIGSFCVGQSTDSGEASLTATGSATIGLPAQPAMARMATSPFQLTYPAPVAYPYALPAGQRARVAITPLRQMAAGPQVDELVWATDVADQPAPRTRVSAEFIATGGAIAPQLVDFGAVAVATDSMPRQIRIQNCGAEAIDLGRPSIEPAGDFHDRSPMALPLTLLPMQTATATVGFAPGRPGTQMATLTVASSKGPLRVNLLGQGLGELDPALDATSFYACDGCSSRAPGGGLVLALAALTVVVVPRRRRRD